MEVKRVKGLVSRDQGVGGKDLVLRVWFRVWCLGFGFRIWGLRCAVWAWRFRVLYG